MVIIATPNDEPENKICSNCEAPPPNPPLALSVDLTQNKEANISKTHEREMPTRRRAIKVVQGQQANIIWQIHDDKGLLVNIDSIAEDEDFKVVLRLKEQLSLGSGKIPATIDMTIVDAEKGEVSGELTKQHTTHPGIYYAEVAVITNEDTPAVIISNAFSLIIERSTFGVQTQNGPPSVAEIRLHLRDSSPAESYLLDNLMFDDAEIALAITRPVMYWNEIPPPIGQFTTQNFPFRYHWLEGICANLFLMVAEQYRRNQLDYAAAGVSVNDQNKEANYERAGQTRWQAYREWVRAKKAEINLESGYGEVGSLYQYGVYSSGIRSRY